MKKWIYLLCGFVYDEALGWPSEGVPPRIRWQDVSNDWKCPDCGVDKAHFKMIEM